MLLHFPFAAKKKTWGRKFFWPRMFKKICEMKFLHRNLSLAALISFDRRHSNGQLKSWIFHIKNSNSPKAIIIICYLGIFESRSGFMDQLSRSVLWPGDWQILLFCICIPAPFTESFDRLERRIILIQMSGRVNRTRVTQPELTLFRAPFPLEKHSFPDFWTLVSTKC